MKFNINDFVRVKLTRLGHATLRRQHRALYRALGVTAAYIPPQEDAEGWSTWPLWELMADLGHTLGMSRELTFATEIEIIEPKARQPLAGDAA